jgi:prepilin-type N-terminal cleavage/methylation domain-containing protein
MFKLLLKIKKLLPAGQFQAGMTLVESLVAIAILAVCASTFILALSTGMTAARLQDTSAIGGSLAQSQMESIKAAAYDSSGASYAPISLPTGYTLTINTNSTIYGTPDIQKVTVTIKYSGSIVSTLEDYKGNR